MSDGTVQLAPDGTGKKVDTSELVRASDGATVERQRIVAADDQFSANLARVFSDGSQLVRHQSAEDILGQVLTELRIHTLILLEGFNLSKTIDPALLRGDPTLDIYSNPASSS